MGRALMPLADDEGGFDLQTLLSGKPWSLQPREIKSLLCPIAASKNCINSDIMKSWSELENSLLDVGKKVCDDLGRRHTDLCDLCAFCSLKREQCMAERPLRRVPCSTFASTTSYVNAAVKKAAGKSGNQKPAIGVLRFDGLEVHAGKPASYWCDRLAQDGCNDPAVKSWLELEYTIFHEGPFPDEICDNLGQLYPNYCSFKSFQCLRRIKPKSKVSRVTCLPSHFYQALSDEEADKVVDDWSRAAAASTPSRDQPPIANLPSVQKTPRRFQPALKVENWDLRTKPLIVIEDDYNK